MSAHARLSPSAAEAWMNCKGQPNAVAGLADETSEAAAEGTAAHTVSELCLATGCQAHDFIGMVSKVEGYTFTWDADDADLLQPGIDEILSYEGQFFGEHQVDLSEWLGPDQFGTLDRAVVGRELIVINDLKWGRATPVSPVANKQLMLYALGLWWNIARHISDAREFLIIIDQPRCAAGGGKWRVSLEELLVFGEEARAAALATNDPNAPRTASAKGCLWCRRRQQPPTESGAVTGCKTFDEFNLALLGQDFADLDSAQPLQVEPVPTMAVERMAKVYEHQKMIEDWLAQIAATLHTEAHKTGDAGGYKVVAGRKSPDKWSDAQAAEALLVETLSVERSFTKKLITPTQASKLVTAGTLEKLADHITRGTRKPTLAPLADERPAITLAHEFDDLPQPTTEQPR